MACFQHGGRLDVRGSALMVGQHVRVLIGGLWRWLYLELWNPSAQRQTRM